MTQSKYPIEVPSELLLLLGDPLMGPAITKLVRDFKHVFDQGGGRKQPYREQDVWFNLKEVVLAE